MRYVPSLDAIATDSEETQYLGQLIGGWMTTQVVRVIARLGVPDHVAGAPRTAPELARLTGADPERLSRVLSAAVVYGLFTKDDQGRFATTAVGELLRSDVPGSLRYQAVGLVGPPQFAGMGRLGDIVNGGPVDPYEVWDYYQRNPEEARWFALGMGGVTEKVVTGLHQIGYTLPPDRQRVVDVGGSRGTLISYLLATVPGATGVLFDAAEALAGAPATLAEAGLADRVDLVAGNFFDEVPEGDVHVLSNVLHNWDDDQARAIIGNCARASRPGGLLVVVGYVPSPTFDPPQPYLLDLLMLAVVGGKERSLAELGSLTEPEGYTLARDLAVPGPAPYRLLEFRR